MKIRLYILLIIFFHSLISFGQVPDWIWAKSAGGIGYDVANSVALDSSGNIYMTGYFYSDTLCFATDTLTNTGICDIFLVKYNSNGNVLWTKSAYGKSWDHAQSLTVDAFENIYVAGDFYGDTLSFDSTILTNVSAGTADIFLTKYDVNGNVLWAKSVGGTNHEEALSVAVDTLGNIYVVGNFQSSTLIFGSTTLTNLGGDDIFLAKYDCNGDVLWAKSAGGTSSDQTYSVSVDAYGNTYVTGYFWSSTITFDTITLTNTFSGHSDIFLAKYDTVGNILWANSSGGTNDDDARSVVVDVSGNTYITGYFSSPTITFGSFTLTNIGGGDIYLVKYDINGNVLWAKSEGGTNIDEALSVAVDVSGNSFVTGYFASPTINFGSTTLTNAGFYDIFLAKYNTSGNLLWVKSAGGTDWDEVNSVAVNSLGIIYVAGFFYSPSLIFDSTTLTNATQNSDIFLAKLDSGIVTRINEFSNSMDISVYPNPTNNIFIVKVPPATRQIQILNSFGQIIQQVIVDRQENFSFTLRKSGLYFIQVMTDKQTVTKKIIVTN